MFSRRLIKSSFYLYSSDKKWIIEEKVLEVDRVKDSTESGMVFYTH